jgi:3-mercaptopyruvate sulfurtransferase SseA
LAFTLNQKQIPETYALKGGTQGWKTAGYPMEGTGGTPIKLEPGPNGPADGPPAKKD